MNTLVLLLALWGLPVVAADPPRIETQQACAVIYLPAAASVSTSTNLCDWTAPEELRKPDTNVYSNYVMYEVQTNAAKFWRLDPPGDDADRGLQARLARSGGGTNGPALRSGLATGVAHPLNPAP